MTKQRTGSTADDPPFPLEPTAPVAARRRVTESQFKAFVDSLYDAYYDWHIQTGVMEMSTQMDGLLRLSPGELPRTFGAWLDRLHPEDRERSYATAVQSARDGTVYRDAYRLRRGDGTYVAVHDRGAVLKDGEGRPAHMIGAIRDVTHEREAERALEEAAGLYQTLFEDAVNPAYQIAEDGRFLDANPAGLAYLATSKMRLLGENVASCWGEEAMEAVRAASAPDGSTTTIELELATGGTLRALTVTLVPCRFRGERICFALGTDISEHRSLQRELEESHELLRRQAAALEDSNTALRVILDQRHRDRAELEQTVVGNIETLVMPLLQRLVRPLASSPEAVYLDALQRSLREVVHPFAQSLGETAGANSPLTAREREIAYLIRTGKTTAEIAEALYVSPATVAFHRKNLRRKLGLPPRGPRLSTHLAR